MAELKANVQGSLNQQGLLTDSRENFTLIPTLLIPSFKGYLGAEN